MWSDFDVTRIDCGEVALNVRRGGDGPPVVLLHGYPQNGNCWHEVATDLARDFHVIVPDLRGYGASSKPPTDAEHAPYAKRAMAVDMVQAMAALGFDRFDVAAHDRGARVAHRLAADHPGAVRRLALLDVAPTREMYAGTGEAFARAYWHWFWLTLPAPHPERMIGADPQAFWDLKCGSGWANGTPGLDLFDPEALAEYRAAWTPETIHASCEDYRAGATIDLAHDDADGDARIGQPLLVLWGARGAVARCFDPLAPWRRRASDVRGHALPAGHYLAEEVPEAVASALIQHFGD